MWLDVVGHYMLFSHEGKIIGYPAFFQQAHQDMACYLHRRLAKHLCQRMGPSRPTPLARPALLWWPCNKGGNWMKERWALGECST